MTIFLIDYENVREGGFAGLADLKEEYEVHLFYSDNANRISLDALRGLRAGFGVHKVLTGKQSLDKQLVSYLGYVIAKNGPEAKYVMVSRDNGFLNTASFWKEELGVQVLLAPDMSGKAERSERTPKEPAKQADQPAEEAAAEKPAEDKKKTTRRESRGSRGRGRTRTRRGEAKAAENSEPAAEPVQETVPAAEAAPAEQPAEAPVVTAVPAEEAAPAAQEQAVETATETAAEPVEAQAAPEAVAEPAAEAEAEAEKPAEKPAPAENNAKAQKNAEKIAARKKQLEVRLAELLVEKQFEKEPGMQIIASVMGHCTDKNVKQKVYLDMVKGFGQKKGLEYYAMLKPLLKQIY